MTKIIDCGNGYGCIEGYPAPSASLTFPLTRTEILRLYARGILNRDEATESLLQLGYEMADVTWAVAVSGVTSERWREVINGLGTV